MEIEESNETDGNIYKPKNWIKPTRVTTVNLDAYLSDDAKRYGIALKDAMDFGLRFLIADKDQIDWPECELTKKLEEIIAQRNELLIKVNELEGLNEGDVEIPKPVVDPEVIDAEIESVLGDVKPIGDKNGNN